MSTTDKHPAYSDAATVSSKETEKAPFCLITAPDNKKASEWSLVLTARGIPHKWRNCQNSTCIEVAGHFREKAETEIREYEAENRNWPNERILPATCQNTETCMFVLMTLCAIMGFALSPEFETARWNGAAWADKILHGQWWRAITALTIHSDPAHLLGNMLTGGFIMVHACWYMGSGLAWFLTVISGVAGNLLNALIQPPAHVSVGSSTAIFGLIGSVTAFRAVLQKSDRIRDYMLPLGAGIALLGFTGSSGKHTDLGAHAFGFISGLVFGAIAGIIVSKYGTPGRNVNFILIAISVILPVTGWFMAMTHTG